MASKTNRADGTDGSGSPRLGGSVVSGKEPGTYGHTASRSMPSDGTVSGKSDPKFGTRQGRSNSRVPQSLDSESTKRGVSKHGGF